MKKEIIAGVLLFFVWLGAAECQNQDSLVQSQKPVLQQDTVPVEPIATFSDSLPPTLALQDSAQVKKRRFLYRVFKEDYPNPNKALYLSLAFPGGGQIYNKRWWKLPFVWGGYIGLIYAVDFNTKNYKLLKDAYLAELDGEPHPFSGTRLKADDLRRLRDQYDKSKQLSYIGLVALHLVQGAEAFVDCHLKTFDVSDDLSFRVKPSIQATPMSGPTLGIGFALVMK